MTDLHTAAKQDIPDLIAGALGVSRGTAYDMMREALAEQPAQRKPLSNGEIYTAYITATNQTLRPQDERLAFAFARAIEAAHGITGATK